MLCYLNEVRRVEGDIVLYKHTADDGNHAVCECNKEGAGWIVWGIFVSVWIRGKLGLLEF